MTKMLLKIHPLCDLFPKLEEDEFNALKKDIEANGQVQDIITLDNQILDGRNRYEACCELGLEPRTVEYEGVDPLGFVMSVNLHRRHLSPGQQAAIVACAQNWNKAQGKGRRKSNGSADPVPADNFSTIDERAAIAGVSRKTQTRAEAVAKADPQLLKDVAAGIVSLPAAYEKINPTIAVEPHAMDDFDPIAELEEVMAKHADLQERYDALVADDSKAELVKYVDLYQAANARLHQETAKNATIDHELKKMGNQLAAIRKVLGVEDDRKLVAAIKHLQQAAQVTQ